MPVKLTCEDICIRTLLVDKSSEVEVKISACYFWHESVSASDGVSADGFVFDRIVELAILRELQIMRTVDIVGFRRRLGLDDRVNSKFAGVMSAYKKQDAVKGETAGTDKSNGYPYKRWGITSGENASKIAKQNKWPLMTDCGKSAILSRSKATTP